MSLEILDSVGDGPDNHVYSQNLVELPTQDEAIDEVLALIHNNCNVFITGSGGTGKSFLISQVVVKLRDEKKECCVTQKATFVLDQRLANQGAFGVQKAVLDANGNVLNAGKNTLMELGFLVTHSWEKEVYENVNMISRLNLYTDYLNSFGNIDIDWELNFNLKVNQYISAQIGTHLIYDDDIKFDVEKAADGSILSPGVTKTQFKQLLGVGVVYEF